MSSHYSPPRAFTSALRVPRRAKTSRSFRYANEKVAASEKNLRRKSNDYTTTCALPHTK
jgi:hypothetical protein